MVSIAISLCVLFFVNQWISKAQSSSPSRKRREIVAASLGLMILVVGMWSYSAVRVPDTPASVAASGHWRNGRYVEPYQRRPPGSVKRDAEVTFAERAASLVIMLGLAVGGPGLIGLVLRRIRSTSNLSIASAQRVRQERLPVQPGSRTPANEPLRGERFTHPLSSSPTPASGPAHVATDIRSIILDAISRQNAIEFDYVKSNGTRSHRVVTPQRLHAFRGSECMEGYCHTRRAERNFALVRMSNMKTHA